MNKLTSLAFGVWVMASVSACGSDEGTEKSTGGASSTGGAGTGTSGSGGGSAMGGSSVANGGSTGGTTTGGSAGAGGTAKTSGGSPSSGGSATTGGTTSTGGGGGSSSGTCQTGCQKIVDANCGDFTGPCSAACQPRTTCVAESSAYWDCTANRGTVACDTAMPMTTTLTGCDAEGNALGICTLCEPDPEDTACGTCNKTSCCTEFKAYASTSDIDPFYDCISADTCTTQACVDGCIAMYPVAGKAYNTIVACQDKSCRPPCYCAPADDETPCGTCLKTNCCDFVYSYVTAKDVAEFAACIDPCTDQACIDDCSTKFPTAGAAWDDLGSQCGATTCATDCG